MQGINKLDRLFTYDPLYRLRSATGRECDKAPPNPPWLDEPRCQDPRRTRAYTRTYDYDSMGNMQKLHHEAPGSGFSFNRNFEVKADSNRLTTVTFAGTPFRYIYDDNGNLEREGNRKESRAISNGTTATNTKN